MHMNLELYLYTETSINASGIGSAVGLRNYKRLITQNTLTVPTKQATPNGGTVRLPEQRKFTLVNTIVVNVPELAVNFFVFQVLW
jgi:hypothetical protein